MFSNLYIISAACFNKCFLFHMTTGMHCFFSFFNVSRYPNALLNRYVLAFFETSDLKEVRILFFISTVRVLC